MVASMARERRMVTCLHCNQVRVHRAKGLCGSCYTNQPKFLHRKIGYEKTTKALLRKKKYYSRKQKEKQVDEEMMESDQDQTESEEMKDVSTIQTVELISNIENENKRSERDREMEDIRQYLCSVGFLKDDAKPPTIAQIQSYLRTKKECLRGKKKVKIGALRPKVIANMKAWIDAEKNDLLQSAEAVNVTVIETRIAK